MDYVVSYSQSGAPARLPPLTEIVALRRLKLTGWQPRSIYDIGALHGEWSKEAAEVFPAAEHFLFEANADHERDLKSSGYRYFIAALGAEDGVEAPFYVAKDVDPSGASLYRENTRHFVDAKLMVRKVVTTRLDSVVAAHGLPLADLAKIDTQGSELDVIAGGKHALSRCGVLIVETSFLNYNKGAPLFADVIAALDKLGMKCVDISQTHHIGPGFYVQADLVFVNDEVYRRYYSAAGLT